MSKTSRRPVFPWIAILLAHYLATGCGGDTPATTDGPVVAAKAPDKSGVITIPQDSPMLSQIRVAPVSEEELAVDEVVSPAKVEIDPSRLSQVLLPVPGRVVQVHVHMGDAVKAGDVLLTLDSPDADAAIADHKQAEADLSAANAAMTKAKSDRERVRGLFEKDAVARKEVDNVEAAFAAARSEVVRVQAERQQAQRKLKLLGITGKSKSGSETIDVRASISGKVLELHVVSGEFHSDTSKPLMTIADLSTVVVSADVAENLIRFIDVNEPVQIDLVAFPGEIFAATVVRIADTVDPQTRTIEVLAALPNPEGRFRPEMFGRVRHGEATTRTPALPQTAVIQRDGQDIVLVETGPGQYVIRAVTLGTRAGDKV
ncbi:MAG TPA: efflux RND transporter periplasmic adaptor subunit, partial [Nannocystis sp.]